MSHAVEPLPFDVCGPLPEGVTVLEASAGTGKTFTIAGLTARYVAAGTPLRDMLIVTFTRMATAELRDRVRERLVSAEQGLDRALAGSAPDADDRVLELLARGTASELEQRRANLAAAVADFDSATIVTTHGFCQEVLGGLGIAGDLEPGVTFVEEVRDLVEEVVDDLYVGAFHARPEALFERSEALAIALAAVRNPGAPLEPSDPAADRLPRARYRLAERVRGELELRKRRLGIMTYDDLLTRLDSALDGSGGDAIAARLRARYRIVLVDEFQDTDPIQWRIVRRAFGDGATTLVLIGDPKQAIYAFRGADVYAYLDAARAAAAQETLAVNWRSDQGLLDAYDALFGDAQLGHPGIVYRRARAAGPGAARPLAGAPDTAPLRVRLVDRAAPGVGTTYNGFARTEEARAHIAGDLARDVAALLGAGPRIAARALEPGDVAVLVRRNVDAELVRAALAGAGVPAVVTGAGSVFDTRAANEWLRLLETLERPTSEPRARTVALTSLIGWSAATVATAGDDRWEDLHGRLHRWAQVLRTRGVAALAETIMLAERVPERVLATPDGERHLTDLRHIGELLHGAAMAEQLGLTALTTWLRHRIADAADELGDEERSRRLESDAAAVQVLTIHRSKGLEFPVVYLPFLWHPSPYSRAGEPVTFHDAGDGDRRKVDVGIEGPGYHRHRDQSIAEQRGEDLRLLYVALTRARHQAVIWWAGTKDSRYSPLGRLVFARSLDGSIAAGASHTPSDAAARARFEQLAQAAPGCVSVAGAGAGGAGSWAPAREPSEALAAATFDRALDRHWRRTSYSDLTAGTHEPRVASEPEGDVTWDEPAEPVPAAAPAGEAPAVAARGRGELAAPSPLAAMPGGVGVGTLVHDVLERTDFAAADLGVEVTAQLERAVARRSIDVGDRAVAAAGLRAAIETPLGPLLGDVRLRDLRRADRLDELTFELPLAGGDRAAGEVGPDAIGAVLRRHVAPGDPLAGYADRLADPALRHAVRGYLTGSIDLVARIPGPVPRFAVVDYKTNWLGTGAEPLALWHHRPAALAAAMQRSHYVLQGLLYTVALHRYLRWRLPGYEPGANLAGIAYLFLRGMVGAATPRIDATPCGVFAWRPPAALVGELSDLLDSGAPG